MIIKMASTVTRFQSNGVSLGCGETGDSHLRCVAKKSAVNVGC